MVAIAVVFCSLGIGMVTTAGSMLGAVAIGLLCYLPVFFGRRRGRAKTSE
jgi:hypothetical protein